MSNPIRNIILDWCGTLVDDLPAVWRATNRVLTQAGVDEMTLEQFRREFELPFRRFYDRYTPHVSMEQLESWYHPAFHAEQHSVRELEHSREFLEFCRRHGIRTFLLSSIHHRHFAQHTEQNGFETFFEKAYLNVHDKREQILELLTAHRLNPEETLFVGDMKHDIETAHHGGVRACAVLTGFNDLEQLRSAKPDWIVEHLGELMAMLDKHEFRPPRPVDEPPHRLDSPVVTVGAAICNDRDEVLMVKTRKWSGLWGIPGGKTRRGETSTTALRREIKEETNLDIEDIEFVLFQDCIDSREFYRSAHFVLLNFSCRAPGDQHVILNEEAEQFEWMPLETALDIPLNQPTRVLLEAVQQLRHGMPITRNVVAASGQAPA